MSSGGGGTNTAVSGRLSGEPIQFCEVRISCGELVKTPGRYGYWAYLPQPLPASLDLPASTVRILSEADRALGRLAGAGRLLPNPHLLLQPYIAREALASSRIEGTQASLSDVFDAQARDTAEGPVREVTNYISALEHGLTRLRTLPLQPASRLRASRVPLPPSMGSSDTT